MVKSDIISPKKANNLFWLGRYEERVYLTMELLNNCFDKMIDGSVSEYEHLLHKLCPSSDGFTAKDFAAFILFNESSPCTVAYALNRAKDNAIMLREEISTETLSFIEMSIAMLERYKNEGSNLSLLQPISDWSLSFWGAADHNIINRKELYMMLVGKNIEKIDMSLRFTPSSSIVLSSYRNLKKFGSDIGYLLYDEVIEERLDGALVDASALNDNESTVLTDINKLVRV